MTSQRLLIAQGLQLLFQNVSDPTTNLPIYATAKLGAILDPTGLNSWCEIVDPRGKVGHAGSGGNVVGWRVQDAIAFKITSGWIYEQDTNAAMVSMLTAQDIILPMMASHYLIPNPDDPTKSIGSVYSVLEDQNQTDMAMPIRFPNGHLYILWSFWALVQQQYNITLIVP